MNYFHVGVYMKQGNPMIGVREFHTDNYDEVYDNVKKKIVAKYGEDAILKIDVWRLTVGSVELQEYLQGKEKL